MEEYDAEEKFATKQQMLSAAMETAVAPPDSINAEILHLLISDDIKDPELRAALHRKFWAVFNKELVLSNLTIDEIRTLYLRLRAVLILYKMSIPKDKLTLERLAILEQIKFLFYLKAKRSVGPDRERVLQTSQFRGVFATYGEGESNKPKGILGRVVGWLSGKK